MMRLGRRASLLLALALSPLTTAATAAVGSVAPRNHRPMRAFTKQADCNEFEVAWNKTQAGKRLDRVRLPPRHRGPARAEGEVN